MKKQFIFRTTVILALVINTLLFTHCKGPQGEPGPTGTAGAKGDKGDPGSTGQTGATGTANVIYGGWIDMSNTSFWSRNGIGFTANFAAPPISQEVLDKGLILVYGRQEGNVILLPHYHNALITTKSHASLQRIFLQLHIEESAGITTFTPILLTGMNHYRYVIVPGTIAGGRKASIDYTNYEEVKKTYHLPD